MRKLVFIAICLLFPSLAQGAGPVCTDVVVQADDWLSKIATKHLGDPAAYPLIVAATNQVAKIDASYATIEDPDLIEPGQKLCIPMMAQQDPASNAQQTPASIAGQNDVKMLYEQYTAKWAFQMPDGKITACYAQYIKSNLPDNNRATVTWDCVTSNSSTPTREPKFEGPKS